MDLSYLLFIAYTCLLCYYLYRSRWYSSLGISSITLVGLFLYKVAMSCIYGWIHKSRYYGSDTWNYFEEAKIVYGSIHTDISHYLMLVFGPNNVRPIWEFLVPYAKPMKFWYNYSSYFIVRIHSFLMPISFGNYYIHCLAFAMINLIGIYLLCKLINAVLGISTKYLFVLLCLWPGIAFWLGGAHKDGIAFFLITALLYSFYKVFIRHFRYIIGIVFFGFLLFRLRSFLLPVVFLGCLIYWLEQRKITPIRKYMIPIVLLLFSLFYIQFLYSPSNNLFTQIHQTQALFYNVPSVQKLYLPAISTPYEFILAFPYIVYNVFVAPGVLNFGHYIKLISSLEGLIILIISIGLLGYLLLSKEVSKLVWPFVAIWLVHWFFLGLLVDNLGTLVRYRTVSLPLLIAAAYICWYSIHYKLNTSNNLT